MTRDELIAYAEAARIRHNIPKPFRSEWYAAKEARLEAQWQAVKHRYMAYDPKNPDTWPVGPARREDWDKPDYETITYPGEIIPTGHEGD